MRVRITAQAQADAEDILRHIAKDNPAAATAVGVAIKAALARLQTFPRIGTQTDEPGILLTIARPYRYLIFYAIDTQEALVQGIRHPAHQRPPAYVA